MIKFLACCHSIVVDQKQKSYNASSPDELALVNAAKEFGLTFRDKDENGNLLIVDYNKSEPKQQTYELLNTCEFTSSRKRMSVIIREPEVEEDVKPKIWLYCKGADS